MRWSYKTVHYELKKEGLLGSAFLDESEVEVSLNEYGRAGWELVSMIETMNGVIAVFKQPLFGDSSPLFQIDSERQRHGGARQKSDGFPAEERDEKFYDSLIEEEDLTEKKGKSPVSEKFETVDAESAPEDEEDEESLFSDQGVNSPGN